MKKCILISLTFCCLTALYSCRTTNSELKFIDNNTKYATEQTLNMLKEVGSATTKNYPRTKVNERLEVTWYGDWTSGFFPGTMWYLYELTGDNLWKDKAEEWTTMLEPHKMLKDHHDIGFIMYCSFGNAERLAHKPVYKKILLQSAESLCSRYNDTVEAIESWNYRKAWNGNEWFFPVIIDNMMNLELLCYATKVSGNPKYKEIAIKHANTTLRNHFRDDFSSFHVVNYDETTGCPIHRQTCQGFSDNSTWARGQAWAIYGYTMMYRETLIPEYLEAAKKFTAYFVNHLEKDMIPLWDFNAGQDGYIPDGNSYAKNFSGTTSGPRDASAAAIVCSALFELGEITKDKYYTDTAIKMLKSLASPIYRAKLGTNANFMIMHCTGSIPHQSEIDQPLVYADYYFTEALTRYKRLLTKGSIYQ